MRGRRKLTAVSGGSPRSKTPSGNRLGIVVPSVQLIQNHDRGTRRRGVKPLVPTLLVSAVIMGAPSTSAGRWQHAHPSTAITATSNTTTIFLNPTRSRNGVLLWFGEGRLR